jgi:hypothetical protein
MHYFIRFLVLTSLWGCAVQNQPKGGPKDENPPRIMEMEPAMGTLNFTGSSASVVFDEYIEAPQLRGSINSTPELNDLTFEIKGKRLVLKWSKSQPLEPDRTYRIDLGDAVQDLNERNAYPSLQFIWSTGSYIDSLRIDGRIKGATADLLSRTTVSLIELPVDSVFEGSFNTRPNKEGLFSFTYLPVDTFHIIAYEDLNFNGTWDASEPFGFSKFYPTREDSLIVDIPFASAPFQIPNWDSVAVDSIRTVIDTLEESELALVEFTVPPHEDILEIWLEHASGWRAHERWVPSSDTVTLPLKKLLPGAYTMYGFIDANSNSIWDGPSFEENVQAEEILAPQKFEFKAHWEVTQPVALPEPELTTVENEKN